MFQYIIKRILIFIPTFFIISLLIFGLSKMATGDPVLLILKGGVQDDNAGQKSDLLAGEEAYAMKAAELGLDKPTFYFSLTSAAYPKDIYTIQKAEHRTLINRLIDQSGNSAAVMNYYNRLKKIYYETAEIENAGYNIRLIVRTEINDLFYDYEEAGILYKLNYVKDSLAVDTSAMQAIIPAWDSLITAYQAINQNPTTYKRYIPTIHFYGLDNQYHTWMFGDYPWFSSVDSSGYYQKDSISAQIKLLRPLENKYSREISTIKGQNYRLKKNIKTATKDKDSLVLVLAQNYSKIKNIETDKAKISKEIENLFVAHDLLFKSLDRYVSKGFLRGDFGVSYTDGKKVSLRLREAFFWTLIMNLIAIFLAYFISIPLGVYSALWKAKGRKLIDNINTTVLFVLYSLPNFWIGTILLVFFTTAEYGEWLDWFPSGGAQSLDFRDDPDIGIFTKIIDIAHHLFLPVFCITYGSLAYLSRQMRGAMSGVIRQDYIRTARAKGLSERKVIWKHAFRNSLFPIITLFSTVFPRSLSGAIAIEMIYAIPGMGYLLLMSITARDWPVVFAVVMLVAILAMIGNLIADILYSMVDPRVTY